MKKPGRNDECWCGSGKKYKKCHIDFDERIEEIGGEGHIVPDHTIIKTPAQIEKIKESAKINIAVLDYVAEHIKAGISTAEIDRWVYDVTTKMGGIPAPLGYEGFPKSVCTSINNEVCHGIPSDDIILKDGDIVNVDVSTNLNGYYSDSSRMFCIGEVSEDKKRLVDAAKQALDEGLKEVKPWGFLGDMAQAVNDYQNMISRFDKKIHDLELTRMISIQMSPQIRLIQNNDTLMVEKIQTSLVNTIPLWKSQMVLALGMHHSQQAMEAQREVTNVTNELLRKNAEALKTGSIEVAKESERGIVDLETLKHTNQTLIDTLEEVRSIQADGAAKRRAAEVELGRIETELREKLVQINK